VFTTSLEVARVFGKEHKHVLEAMRNLECLGQPKNRQSSSEVGLSKSGQSSKDTHISSTVEDFGLRKIAESSSEVGLLNFKESSSGAGGQSKSGQTSKDTDRNFADSQEDFTHLNFKGSYYKDASGKRNKMYKLTRDGFVFLAMGFTGKKAAQFKIAYIQAFNAMEKELKGRMALTANYKWMGEALQESRKLLGKETRGHHYSNEADMLNRLVFGRTSAELKEEFGDDFREKLPAEQVKVLDALERINASLLEVGIGYHERKALLEKKLPATT
jgi:Rha family phage regulatory protein